jgi:hypothetical protein
MRISHRVLVSGEAMSFRMSAPEIVTELTKEEMEVELLNATKPFITWGIHTSNRPDILFEVTGEIYVFTPAQTQKIKEVLDNLRRSSNLDNAGQIQELIDILNGIDRLPATDKEFKEVDLLVDGACFNTTLLGKLVDEGWTLDKLAGNIAKLSRKLQ